MSETIEIQVEEVLPPPEPIKRGRGRPVGTCKENKKTADPDYQRNYYLNKLKPVYDSKEIYECKYCNKQLKYNSIRTHDTKGFCSRFLRNKIQ